MLLIGVLVGSILLELIDKWDHWVAFAILFLLGVKMIAGAVSNKKPPRRDTDLTRGFNLLGFSIAVSIDALAAGVGISSMRVPVYFTVLVVGAVSAIMTVIGMKIGERAAKRLGRYSEIVAGLVLIGLGVKILIEHIS